MRSILVTICECRHKIPECVFEVLPCIRNTNNTEPKLRLGVLMVSKPTMGFFKVLLKCDHT